jgi:predicted dehydrogenase
MDGIRVGVIGVGHLGQHHARLYSELSDVVLVGVADADLSRCHGIAHRHGVQAFHDVATLLEQVDAVSIAVPTSSHYAVVKTALMAGVHVLVEKPITAALEEATELIELAKQHGAVLQVGHIERFNPAIQLIRPHIERPTFIECCRLGPFGLRGTDVDVVRDLMIHDLDMLLSFNLGPIQDVHAAGVSVLSRTVDVANARLTFQNGCIAALTASRVSPTAARELRLSQPSSYITVDYRSQRGVIQPRLAQDNRAGSLRQLVLEGMGEEPLKLELQSFIESVRDGVPPAVSGEDGLAALEIAHRVLAGIRTFLERHEGSHAPMALSV